jgi:carbonic anhydrase/acetyltransferase-like protein (isoleucine patch superfamily)
VPTVIGEDVTVGHGAIIHACSIGDAMPDRHGRDRARRARVERNGFVGAGAVIAPGKVVGSGELWLGKSRPLRCAGCPRPRSASCITRRSIYLKLKDRYLGQVQD